MPPSLRLLDSLAVRGRSTRLSCGQTTSQEGTCGSPCSRRCSRRAKKLLRAAVLVLARVPALAPVQARAWAGEVEAEALQAVEAVGVLELERVRK